MGAATDGQEIVRLSKEHAELRPVAEAAAELAKARAEAPELEAMLKSGDDDLIVLAEEELAKLPELERAEEVMDPNQVMAQAWEDVG